MSTAKRGLIALLRVLGILALVGGLVAVLVLLETDRAVEPAEFFFVGTQDDADCAVLLSRGACVVIDTGEEQDADRIVRLLREKNVQQIDCLILTHPDKDHIGGAPRLLDEFSVSMVIVPYYIQENEPYTLLREKMTAMNIHALTLARNREFQYGDLRLRVFPPDEFLYNKDNNYSLVTRVEHGNVRMLFMGDAQKERLLELEDVDWGKVDLYKAPHHGRESTIGAALIERLQPVYAVVTAKAPESNVKAALERVGAQVLCTVPLQDAHLLSDGQALSLAQ